MAKKVTTIPATITKFSQTPINRVTKRRVAAYARVSTEQEEQQTSYEAQIDYYTNYIQGREDWEFAGMYSDEGITATNTKKRIGFQNMVADALAGKVDLIITKSVSRFARNTVDSLTTVRQLKEKGVEIYFEKENIWTLDSKGELLITIMSSLAQEESRSISENVVWGQRKRFADGKVTVPFKRFLGYDMGEDRNLVVNPEQAKIVKRIYGLFLQGKAPHTIAKLLTDEPETLTPAGKQKWNPSTIKSILTNEKYKGDALLQKSYTVDFLTKEKKANEGEIPQYYVKGNHEAIIQPEIFDMVQKQMALRTKGNHRRRSNSTFSSKLICGDCGSFYGSKVWHSNTKYRRTVWRCNHKYGNDEKCETPHLTEDEIKEVFIKATNQLVNMKEEVIRNYEEMKEMLFGTAALESEQAKLEDELNEVAGLIEDCINENARVALDQSEYEKRYNGLVERFDTASGRLEEIKEQITERQARGQQIEMFLKDLEKVGVVVEFEDDLFLALVESIEVGRDKVVVRFKDGTEVEG
ncbi:recombinase family protein [Lactococcus formosensis]|uniref:recombinase family protein n=1 Tax=Lactococcus formosensis TaxID=1281486 RepID=UPI002434845D|nr:recombinase family protein [Lactococcus formosensis]MDG6162059.1 recombinase family protein [Lactococcus formosensis]